MVQNWFDASDSQIMNGKTSSDTSPDTVSNCIIPASHEVPVTVGNNGVDTSDTPRAMSLTMAETLVHGSPCSHSPAQLSDSAQKLEEMALKKSRLLVPMMPYLPRSMAASSLVKLKVKTSPQRHPISPSGNSHDFNALRELNGVSLATKHNLRFNGRRMLTTTSNATSASSAWLTLEKKPTFQTQSRRDFLKNLSRKGFSKDASRVLEKFKESTENDISCSTPESRDSTNEEQQCSTNFILNSEEEEIAFLRSLGWEEDNENEGDECLTEEEIQDFYDKYAKLHEFGDDGAESDNHMSMC